LVFFFTGVILLFLALWLWEGVPAATTQQTLAQVIHLEGQVSFRSSFLSPTETLTSPRALPAHSVLETGSQGYAVIEFPSAQRIRLPPGSRISLEPLTGASLLRILAGQIKVESSGREDGLLIQTQNLRMSPAEYQSLFQQRNGKQPQAKAVFQNPLDFLRAVEKRKRFFERCYTQLQKRAPESRGHVQIEFSISETGKTRSVRVLSQNLGDRKFQECLETSARRLDFRPIVSKASTLVLPLRFE
ncbi:MAG: AgmX/PglI C-terminal domain-containing protein, partial [Bdellovibrionaceae bacterium]|nr:AgmX/PglI C-terminal domain-containing protein [Pseudobdellovibrionaceae bacterium]